LIYGIVASAFKVDGPVDYQGYFQCNFINPAMYAAFGLLGLYAIIIIVFLFLLL